MTSNGPHTTSFPQFSFDMTSQARHRAAAPPVYRSPYDPVKSKLKILCLPSSQTKKSGDAAAKSVRPPMGPLLMSGEYSDMTIICNGETFKVHRAILCVQSTFFETCGNGKWKEGQDNNTICLDDEDPELIKAMLRFCYTMDYEKPEPEIEDQVKPSTNKPGPFDDDNDDASPLYGRPSNPGNQPPASLFIDRHPLHGVRFATPTQFPDNPRRNFIAAHFLNPADTPEYQTAKSNIQHAQIAIQLYALADRLLIPGLKTLTAQRFEHLTTHTRGGFLPSDMSTLLSEVCSTTPPSDHGLRDICIALLRSRPSILADLLATDASFTTVLCENGEIAAPLLAYATKALNALQIKYEDLEHRSKESVGAFASRERCIEHMARRAAAVKGDLGPEARAKWDEIGGAEEKAEGGGRGREAEARDERLRLE